MEENKVLDVQDEQEEDEDDDSEEKEENKENNSNGNGKLKTVNEFGNDGEAKGPETASTNPSTSNNGAPEEGCEESEEVNFASPESTYRLSLYF